MRYQFLLHAAQVGFVPMLDVAVKVLLLAFTLVVGGCFALWPEQVWRRFDSWRARPVSVDNEAGFNPQKFAALYSVRLMGILLIALTCYLIYSWNQTS